MADKFRNKYRINSHRKPNWDYSSNGQYYITIVTKNRFCYLGEVTETNGNILMQLSDFGKIVKEEWLKSFEIRKELFLHEYIIMPNHIHAIVEINNNKNVQTICARPRDARPRDARPCVSTQDIIRLPESISSFIAGFKSSVNTKIDDYIDQKNLRIEKFNRNNHFFQPNYNDRIIRDYMEYIAITDYIIKNPENWYNDRLNERSK